MFSTKLWQGFSGRLIRRTPISQARQFISFFNLIFHKFLILSAVNSSLSSVNQRMSVHGHRPKSRQTDSADQRADGDASLLPVINSQAPLSLPTASVTPPQPPGSPDLNALIAIACASPEQNRSKSWMFICCIMFIRKVFIRDSGSDSGSGSTTLY